MRGIATHTQVKCLKHCATLVRIIPFCIDLFYIYAVVLSWYLFMQAMSAQSSVAVGMKGASKAMEAMNKVSL